MTDIIILRILFLLVVVGLIMYLVLTMKPRRTGFVVTGVGRNQTVINGGEVVITTCDDLGSIGVTAHGDVVTITYMRKARP